MLVVGDARAEAARSPCDSHREGDLGYRARSSDFADRLSRERRYTRPANDVPIHLRPL